MDSEKVDVLAVLDHLIQLQHMSGVGVHGAEEARDAVAELIEAAEDARSALYSCIDALTSDEPDDHAALDRITSAIARMGGNP